eukprot:scaffold30041_cov107-Isochrysis_galbana.AAC.5
MRDLPKDLLPEYEEVRHDGRKLTLTARPGRTPCTGGRVSGRADGWPWLGPTAPFAPLCRREPEGTRTGCRRCRPSQHSSRGRSTPLGRVSLLLESAAFSFGLEGGPAHRPTPRPPPPPMFLSLLPSRPPLPTGAGRGNADEMSTAQVLQAAHQTQQKSVASVSRMKTQARLAAMPRRHARRPVTGLFTPACSHSDVSVCSVHPAAVLIPGFPRPPTRTPAGCGDEGARRRHRRQASKPNGAVAKRQRGCDAGGRPAGGEGLVGGVEVGRASERVWHAHGGRWGGARRVCSGRDRNLHSGKLESS